MISSVNSAARLAKERGANARGPEWLLGVNLRARDVPLARFDSVSAVLCSRNSQRYCAEQLSAKKVACVALVAGPMFEKAKSKGCDCGPAVEKAKQAVEKAKQAVAPYASKAGAALGMAPKPSPNGGWNVVEGSSTTHTTA
ncbi:unnamed protein product [Polarella glacialis]|uniref:Uncharacterized protein n=1 Tax=Polarella glacialis TaxID=89957 RepID=A0A813JCK7_POLGL|nr:unnamed protein product [Polarella glacialis]